MRWLPGTAIAYGSPANRPVHKTERIYVAGHGGLAGSAIVRCLQAQGCSNLILRAHSELDLTEQDAVRNFFDKERPQYVFLAAAKAGGILANSSFPADFVYANLAIQANVVHAAWRAGVKRLLFLGSSCIYPRDCPQPMKEEYLLSGPLEPTNRPYAVAKIAGIEQCWSYNRQHGTRYLATMPTNLYGLGDRYDLETAHVLPALIRKIHEAKASRAGEFVVWGTGRPLREFLYADDMADACVFLMGLEDAKFSQLVRPDVCPLINMGYGEELSVAELAKITAEIIGYEGQVRFDTARPDGTPRKILDSSRMLALGWRPKVGLREGIARAYADFQRRFAQLPSRAVSR
jgi:GDP-L-fucose synthase